MTRTEERETLPGTSTVTPEEAAVIIGCSLSMVYKLLKLKQLACRRVGNRYRIFRDSIGDYLTQPWQPVEKKRAGGKASKPPAGRRSPAVAGKPTPFQHIRPSSR